MGLAEGTAKNNKKKGKLLPLVRFKTACLLQED